MNWREHLQNQLRELQPASICALDESARLLAASALPATPVSMSNTLPDASCGLALGVDVLKGLDDAQARHLISQTRLYTAPRILLAAQPECALDEEAFRALGFTLLASDLEDNSKIYYYDLDTYKTVPDWLNSRYWAHPERWKP